MIRTSTLAIVLALSSGTALAQHAPAGDTPSEEARADAPKPDPDTVKASAVEDAQPVKRSVSIRGRSLSYTVTPGHLTIRNDKGEPTASMFYVAYTVPSGARPRPVTFLFNGGPGSSTMWLHMGSFGPIKVDASVPETVAGPPFRYGPNPDSLLDVTDLVFIDADKPGYPVYYEEALRRTRRNGLILFDNVLAGGLIAQAAGDVPEDRREYLLALQGLNDELATDERVDLAMVGIADGLTLARKR